MSFLVAPQFDGILSRYRTHRGIKEKATPTAGHLDRLLEEIWGRELANPKLPMMPIQWVSRMKGALNIPGKQLISPDSYHIIHILEESKEIKDGPAVCGVVFSHLGFGNVWVNGKLVGYGNGNDGTI